MSKGVLDLPTLVLNRQWQPVHMTTVARSFILLWNDAARVVEPVARGSVELDQLRGRLRAVQRPQRGPESGPGRHAAAPSSGPTLAGSTLAGSSPVSGLRVRFAGSEGASRRLRGLKPCFRFAVGNTRAELWAWPDPRRSSFPARSTT